MRKCVLVSGGILTEILFNYSWGNKGENERWRKMVILDEKITWYGWSLQAKEPDSRARSTPTHTNKDSTEQLALFIFY